MPRMRQESSGADSSRVWLRDAEGRGNGRIRHVSQERVNLGCDHFLSELGRLGVYWMAAGTQSGNSGGVDMAIVFGYNHCHSRGN